MASPQSSTSSFSGMLVVSTIGWLVVFADVMAGGITFVTSGAAFVPTPFVMDVRAFVVPGGFGTGGNQTPTSHCHKNSAAKDAAKRRTVFRSMKVLVHLSAAV